MSKTTINALPMASEARPEGTDSAPMHAISVDVEDYFMVLNFRRGIPREEWPQLPSRVVPNTELILDLFEKHNVKGTFFTLGVVADEHPNLVRQIAARGHEVASHGWSHTPFNELNPQQAYSELLRSKQLLEDLSGQDVIGYRAPSFSVRPDTLWALDVLLEAGYKYDSSIFPTRHPDYGIPDAPRSPGLYPTPKGAEILEYPMTVAPFLGKHLPVSGGGYFRLFPEWFTTRGFEKVQAQGRPGVFYLHPWEVDPGQPNLKHRTSRLGALRHYVNLKKTAGRLDRLLGRFQFGTLQSVLRDRGLLKE